MASNPTVERRPAARKRVSVAVSLPEPRTDKPAGYISWLLLAGLSVVLLAQLWSSVRLLSVTYDEIDHLHAGYRYLICGDFGWNPEHPPLAKMVDALPLLFENVQDPIVGACGYRNHRGEDFRVGHDFLFANSESVLLSARMVASLFSVALLWVVWLATRHLFGIGPAIIAGILLTFEPTLLAHGALVTTDVPAALGFAAAVFAFYGYLRRPTHIRCALAGIATGIAFTVKFSSVLLVPVLIVLAVADPLLVKKSDVSRKRRILRNAMALVVIFAVGLLAVWTVYGWSYNSRPGYADVWTNSRLHEVKGRMASEVIPALESHRFLPEAYLHGFQDVLVESEIGRPSFLLGRLYPRAAWFYLPVAASIKISLAVLLLTAIACSALGHWRRSPREVLVLIVPSLLYAAASLTSGLSVGIRYLLPVLPFMIVFASAGVWDLVSRHRRWQAVLGIVLALHVVSSLHAFPNYLSYSNELWGGPSQTYKFLADSDVDWGQAMKQAKKYLDGARPASCWTIYPYYVKNGDYGISCGESSAAAHGIPPLRFTGTIITSSSSVATRQFGGEQFASVFHDRKPVAKLGGSALLVYEGEFDLHLLAAYQHLEVAKKELGSNRQLAMAEAEAAEALAPDVAPVHTIVCSLARLQGEALRAERECNLALRLTRSDLTVSAADAAGLVKFMQQNGMKIDAPPSPSER